MATFAQLRRGLLISGTGILGCVFSVGYFGCSRRAVGGNTNRNGNQDCLTDQEDPDCQ